MKYLYALIALFLTLGVTPAQAELLKVQSVTSPSGIQAWLIEDHSVPVIAIQFAFDAAGSAQDTAKTQGLAQLMSNTMDEGAGDLDAQAFQKQLDDHSITLRFRADRDHFYGSLKTLSRYKDKAFDLTRLALTQPRFDPDALERMVKANQSRIQSARGQGEWMGARLLNDSMYPGHPYRFNSGGTLSTLAALTPKQLRTYHQKALARDNLRIAVTGDISARKLAPLLDTIFKELPAHADLASVPDIALDHDEGSVSLYKQDTPQSFIYAYQSAFKKTDPKDAAYQVLNFVLGSSGFGSRLTKTLREDRGLTYGIYSYFDHKDHSNALIVSTSTKAESTAEAIQLIRNEWKKLAKKPITEEELSDAKAYLTGSMPLALTSSDAIASLLLSLQLEGLPATYLEQRSNEIKALNLADITDAAKRLLKPDALSFVVVGSAKGMKVDHEIKELPNVE